MRTRHSSWLLCLVLLIGCREGKKAPDGGLLDGGFDAGERDGGELDGSFDAGEEACPPLGEGTAHPSGLESDDEVWTAEGSPHVVSFAVRVGAGQRLTIEPCAVVQVRSGLSIEVADGGELVAEGTATRPIRIERHTADAPWAELLVRGDTSARLAYVTLEGGGAPSTSPLDRVSSLRVTANPNDDVPVRQTLRVDHVTIRNSASLGAMLDGVVGFTDDSRELVIEGSASAPLRVWQRGVYTIPTGSYSGNADDRILLERGFGYSAIVGTVTIRDRGLPYRVLSRLLVGTSGPPQIEGTLVIEPGVTLLFDPEMTLEMAGTDGSGTGDLALGSLQAVGTAERPIVFGSAAESPAAGDWGGLIFNGIPSGSRIEHAVIAYAGGGNGNASASCGDGTGSASDEAAVTLKGWDAMPSASFIQHTRIEHSPRFGIVCGWRGDPVDFLSTNEFVDVASCWVSAPRSRANGCPEMPDCPGG